MPIITKTLDCLFRGRRFYVVVLFVCLLEWLALSVVAPNCYFDSDSVSYFYPVNLFAGRISASRPPVYCLFLNALRCFGDMHLKTCVVFMQFVVLLGTILLAAKMLRSLFCHEIPILVVCGLLALQGYFWGKAILPECFSFCMAVLVLFLFWRMDAAPSKMLVWSLNLLVALAIFLKPVFAIMAIALSAAWFFRILTGNGVKGCVKSILLSGAVAGCVIVGYCFLMQARHGFFGLSSVSVQNDLLDIVSSSAWETCADSPAKSLLSDELQKNGDPYAGAFAVQWAVVPRAEEAFDIYDICPKFLFESENVRYCLRLAKQYDKGHLYGVDTLRSFVREAKRQPRYYKYELQKLLLGIGAPQGVLLMQFWLGAVGLAIACVRRDHVLFFANLLFLGFIASVIFKSDMEQNARLLYPVYLVPLMDLLQYFKLAVSKNGNGVLPQRRQAISAIHRMPGM